MDIFGRQLFYPPHYPRKVTSPLFKPIFVISGLFSSFLYIHFAHFMLNVIPDFFHCFCELIMLLHYIFELIIYMKAIDLYAILMSWYLNEVCYFLYWLSFDIHFQMISTWRETGIFSSSSSFISSSNSSTLKVFTYVIVLLDAFNS